MLSGEDATALAFLAQGGDGCISVTANVAPRACAEMHAAWQKGDAKHAHRDQRPARRRSTRRCSSKPARRRSNTRRRCLDKSTPEVRLPLVAASAEAQARVESAMRSAGLLN